MGGGEPCTAKARGTHSTCSLWPGRIGRGIGLGTSPGVEMEVRGPEGPRGHCEVPGRARYAARLSARDNNIPVNLGRDCRCLHHGNNHQKEDDQDDA